MGHRHRRFTRRRSPDEAERIPASARSRAPDPESQASSDAPQAEALRQIQHTHGNAFVQRMLAGAPAVQREAGARPFNPLDPEALRGAAAAVVERNEAPVRAWLDANTDRLMLLGLPDLVARVRREVPEAARLADGEIASLAQQWAQRHNISIPPVSVLPASGPAPAIAIPEAVKRAFSIPIEGVDLVRGSNGRLNIAVRGVTAQLGRGKATVSWGGSLGLDIPVGGFHLGATVSGEKWEMTLSTPGEDTVPDLNKLGEVFSRAEGALRGILGATAEYPGLTEIPELTARISPHVKPVKEAVEALKAIAEAPRVSFGVRVEGPGSKPGADTPAGVTVSATLTVRF